MSTKTNDRIHLIENQVSMHKNRPKPDRPPQEPKIREKKEGRREHPAAAAAVLAASATTPLPDPPVTTVVISSSSGVHVAQQPRQSHAMVS